MRSTAFLFALLFAFTALPVFGQTSADESSDKDRTEPIERQDQLMVDFTWDYLLNVPDSVKLQPYSRGINVYGFFDLPLGKGNVALAGGVGFSSSNYFMDAGVARNVDTLGNVLDSYLKPFASDSSYKRNKLSVNYVDVPIELRFRIKPKNREQAWKIAVGGRVGYLVNAHSKHLTNDRRYKDYYLPNVAKLRYGASVRVGFGKVNLFGYYGISTLFEDGKGPGLNPLTVGISLAPF